MGLAQHYSAIRSNATNGYSAACRELLLAMVKRRQLGPTR
jgi:hypothetical protein